MLCERFQEYTLLRVFSNSRMYGDKVDSWHPGVGSNDRYRGGGKYGHTEAVDKTTQLPACPNTIYSYQEVYSDLSQKNKGMNVSETAEKFRKSADQLYSLERQNNTAFERTRAPWQSTLLVPWEKAHVCSSQA